MTENHNQDGTDGGMSRRGLFGASLAAASGIGLLSMTGSAMAQQDGTVYLRDAHIGPSGSQAGIESREGWMYFETDTGDIYYDNDGTGWTSLGGGTASSRLTVIDSSDESPYSTEGSSVVYVDTSSMIGNITLTIDSASEVDGAPLEIYDIGGEAGAHKIRIENSTGGYVTTLDVDQAYTELIYSDNQWLIKTGGSEGVWRTESDPLADFTIPDAQDLHARYDWTQASGTSKVIDQTGNENHLEGEYAGPITLINGKQSGRFYGKNSNEISVNFDAEDTPISIFLVLRFESIYPSHHNYVYDSAGSTAEIFLNEDGNSWEFGGSSFYSGGTVDKNTHIISAIYASSGNTSKLFIDGEQNPTASGDIKSNRLNGFLLGDDSTTTNRNASFSVGEILIYTADKESVRSEIETYLSDKWSVALV